MNPGEYKNELRAALIAKRREYRRNAEADRMICGRLTQSDIWADCGTVFIYLPLSWENGTQEIIDAAFAEGKRVSVPVCVGDEMIPILITPETEYKRGKFGIKEPADGERVILTPQSLIIVPALAFDRTGGRLGRGGGYYDRFLARTDAVSAGICYSRFLFDGLPSEAHDEKVKFIFTEEGVLRI